MAIDLLTMRQIDASHEPSDLPDTNPTIDLPPGSRPFAIVIDPQDKYAYISDRNTYDISLGLIYVLDIDPASETFHKVVKTMLIRKLLLKVVIRLPLIPIEG